MKYTLIIIMMMFWGSLLNAQTGHADCNVALVVCNKYPLAVDLLPDAGADVAEVNAVSCLGRNFPESNSAWLTWTVDKGGSMGFTLLPAVRTDDLDFILFKLNGTGGDRYDRTEIRCMVSGKILGETTLEAELCTGATGLSATAEDVSEPVGCRNGHDNFLSQVTAAPGETYLLFVNNYRSSNGFLIEFYGECTFKASPAECLASTGDNALPSLYTGDHGPRFSNVYPNPAVGEIALDVWAASEMEGRLELIDVHGRIAKTQQVAIARGAQTFPLPVGDLQPGAWFVKISSGNSSCLSIFYKK